MLNTYRGTPVFAYPFRPFFLLLGLYGFAVVLAWAGHFFGLFQLPLAMPPTQWHAHEMIFGFVAAAIAGFLLTAMTNWTGAPPLQGRGLQGLVGLWLAGRAAMWLSGWLPPVLVAVLDLAFLPVVAVYAGRVLLRYGNTRNLMLVAILALLSLANLAMHLGFFTGFTSGARLGEVLALDLITLIMVVVAGRIVPAFSANWLRMNGQDPAQVRRPAAIDKIAVPATALVVLADLVPSWPALAGGVALVAAVGNGARLFAWRGWLTAREPLLWILHLAYAWIVAALLVKGLDPFLAGVTASAWFHVLGAGAVGTLILGVVTRVCLGHTGRPMRLMQGAVLMYACILGAGLLRSLAAFGIGEYGLLVNLAALLWAGAFSLFVLLYWPILTRPRPDGRPG